MKIKAQQITFRQDIKTFLANVSLLLFRTQKIIYFCYVLSESYLLGFNFHFQITLSTRCINLATVLTRLHVEILQGALGFKNAVTNLKNLLNLSSLGPILR
jgi:hypothetical protein